MGPPREPDSITAVGNFHADGVQLQCAVLTHKLIR
jgi:hypothetical protein